MFLKVSSQKSKQVGFTLIELLVVISIISLLASIMFASLNSAHVKARDAKRIADMQEIYKALQLDFDQKGFWPTTSSYGGANPGGWDYSSQGVFLPFLVTDGFFPTVPVDPINNGTGDVYYGGTGYSYAYYCYSSENSLTLAARLENAPAYTTLLSGRLSGDVYWIANHERGYLCQ